jgi:phage/plasmid-like protein (TIGR03299 family)
VSALQSAQRSTLQQFRCSQKGHQIMDNIATINNRSAISYIDGTPWHGLGDNVLTLMREATPDRYVDIALDAAQMRFAVGSLPMQMADGTPIAGHKVSVRFNPDGSVAAQLGVVGNGYQHIQNDEACSILRVLAEEFGCVPAVAGVLGDGQRCWMLMRMTDATITPIPGDDVRGYFLLHWAHDGSMMLQGLGTGVRVVCQNTLALATRGRKAWIAIRHSGNAQQKLDAAAKIVRKVGEALKTTGDTFAAMARKVIDSKTLHAYLDAVVIDANATDAAKPSKIITARKETIAALMRLGKGADMANQYANGGVSLWAAYNAVTEYFDHVRPAEASSAAGLRNAQTSAVFGANADTKAQALSIAQQLLGAA